MWLPWSYFAVIMSLDISATCAARSTCCDVLTVSSYRAFKRDCWSSIWSLTSSRGRAQLHSVNRLLSVLAAIPCQQAGVISPIVLLTLAHLWSLILPSFITHHHNRILLNIRNILKHITRMYRKAKSHMSSISRRLESPYSRRNMAKQLVVVTESLCVLFHSRDPLAIRFKLFDLSLIHI